MAISNTDLGLKSKFNDFLLNLISNLRVIVFLHRTT